MGIDNKLFTSEKISKAILKLALPITISLFVSELYNMVDTIFVGRYIGPNAIGALTVAFPIQRLLISLGLLIAVGTSTFMSRSLGEKNFKSLRKSLITSLTTTILLLTSVSLLIFFFKKPIISALGASDTLYPLAKEYIIIILIGGVFQCIGVVLSYVMTALGNAKITLYSNSLGALINIVIDFILVAKLDMGVKGAAIATVISQIIALIYVLYSFYKVREIFALKNSTNYSIISTQSFKNDFNIGILISIISIGFSSFIIEISDAIVAIILNNILYSHGGDNAIIIVGVITKVSMFMFITIIGISSAIQPIIAYNHGCGNKMRIKEVLKMGGLYLIITSFILWSILMIFANSILSCFLTDTYLLPIAIKAFRICISLLPTVCIYYMCIYYYQAINEAKLSFILSIYRQLILFIPLAFILVRYIGITGAWISYPISDIISAITSLYFMKKTKISKTKYKISYKKAIFDHY